MLDIMERTLLDPLRLQNLARLSMAVNNENVSGCVVEVGAFRGGSAKWLATVNPLRKMHVFDTFTGIPYDPWELDGHKKGDFTADYDDVCRYLSSCPNVTVHRGVFPASMPADLGFVALAHVDVDMEHSVRDCIVALWPRITKGGVLIFDDYNAEACPGLKRAVDEMFRDEIVIGPHPQAWVRKGETL